MSAIHSLPDAILGEYQKWRERFCQQGGQVLAGWLDEQCAMNPGFFQQLQLVWGCSDFVADYACRHPQRFQELVDSGDLNRNYPSQEWRQFGQSLLAKVSDDSSLATELRRFRNREMTRIIWRDFAGVANLDATTADMTALAECCLQTALDYLYQSGCATSGVPIGQRSGQPQQLVVLGMGKLGAGELNVSSDIDLIFAYPESGETDGSGTGRSRSNHEFFERLGRKLIQALDARTVDGFVFRVDMRLRPYGGSGPLVGSFDALETYYQTQGRDWERFAMIKARPVAGDLVAGRKLLEALRPFTYRKYIDFGAIEALREIKALIEHEVHRTGAHNDIKRGAGGIREVEFIGQAFQLIRGGRDQRLQQPALLTVLPLLEELHALPEGKADELIKAYRFLRRVEHAVQGIADRQTQKLPSDELGRWRVATLNESRSWSDFEHELSAHRKVIQDEFAQVVSAPVSEQNPQDAQDVSAGQLLWQMVQREKPLTESLGELGFEDPQGSEQQLFALLASKPVQLMQASARERLDRLMPILLLGCAEQENSSQLLQRVLKLVEAVARRSAYLALLVENPGALQQLLTLCAASPWIGEQIASWPALLDELLDPRTLYSPHDKFQLADELRQQLLRIPEDDLEAQLEVLRYFKRSNSLRVAACEVTDALPLMKVSDNLTWIAEVLIEQVLQLAWKQLVERHGEPGVNEGEPKPGFLVVGYGKLGGIELGHNSDLDLVFLYRADPNLRTSGERSIDNATFFLRLGQRVIHLLTTQTTTGVLYEVDMRLRPSGNSGMLVTTLAGFAKYQLNDAWTWEHQALVRARVIAGDAELVNEFGQVREQVMLLQRDQKALAQDVAEMRNKMAEHLNNAPSERFDLKQGSGGIVDIEFMVQFAVLAWANECPALARWSDNIRILESLAESGKLDSEQVEQLIKAYKTYRIAGHRAQLQQQPGTVDAEQFTEQRQQVRAIWKQLLPTF